MAADEASDVTKALAAFGAPSIRYHSFGQSPGRLPTIATPRPVVKAEPPPSLQEPEAAPAPMAASPRPLAEWAPPASAAPQPLAMPPLAVPPPASPSPAPAALPFLMPTVPPASEAREPTHVVVPPMPRPPPAPDTSVAGPAALPAVAAAPPTRGAAGRASRTLAEIFELLASAPSAASPGAQATPELFRRG